MRADLLKKTLSDDVMSSRPRIIHSYLNSFPSSDNKSFSQGEMIKIFLSMLIALWLGSMATDDLETSKNSYEELIEHK